MQSPIITDVLSSPLGGDWIEEPLYFFVGALSVPDNFTGCTVVGGLYLNGALKLDLAPYCTLVSSPAAVMISAPKAAMIPLGCAVFQCNLWLQTLTQLQPLIAFAFEQTQP